MFLIFKEVVVVTLSIFTAFLAGFGLSPEAAFAPDTRLPTKIVFEFPEKETSTEVEAVYLGETEARQESEPELSETEQLTEEAIDAFEDLANAFEQLAEETTNPPQQTAPTLSTNEVVRGALVNIVCITETGGAINPISGSGVVVDPRGVILTNAHVAQFFLLEDYPRPNALECVIRTGSPARSMYTADLMFLPPSWIQNNAQKIDDATPTGNGEHDWALVRITGPVSANVEMPTAFPYLRISLGTPSSGNQVLVAGYPAGFLGGITVAKELYAASASAQVEELYTFGTQSIDLFSIGGSVVAQQGSSGGAVATPEGILTGVIVTSTDAPDTASRDLRALATRYIVEDFESETGLSLATYLSGNLTENTNAFHLNIMPTLSAALISVLEN